MNNFGILILLFFMIATVICTVVLVQIRESNEKVLRKMDELTTLLDGHDKVWRWWPLTKGKEEPIRNDAGATLPQKDLNEMNASERNQQKAKRAGKTMP
jgi:hypothetical protein